MRRSAGVLLYRQRQERLEVLLVHPGGPFWRHKDDGSWSIPKGEIGEGEAPEDAARRELAEETGAIITEPIRPLVRYFNGAGNALSPSRWKAISM
jgi:predicted NUDIX family NTP pyrophosphohydrolase